MTGHNTQKLEREISINIVYICNYIHLGMFSARPFVITLVDLSFFVGAGKALTKLCFNNHWGIWVAEILWLKQQLTHPHWWASIMVWCSLPWGIWLGRVPALVCFCHSAPVLCLSLSLLSLSLLHTHTHWFILLFTLSHFRFLPLSGWQHTPNKMEFGAFEKPAAQPPNTSVLSGDWALVIEWAPSQQTGKLWKITMTSIGKQTRQMTFSGTDRARENP